MEAELGKITLRMQIIIMLSSESQISRAGDIFRANPLPLIRKVSKLPRTEALFLPKALGIDVSHSPSDRFNKSDYEDNLENYFEEFELNPVSQCSSDY